MMSRRGREERRKGRHARVKLALVSLTVLTFVAIAFAAAVRDPGVRDRVVGARIVAAASGVGMSAVMWHPNIPLTSDLGGLCLSKPGAVTIDSVKPVRPTGGFEVTDFAVIRRADVVIGSAEGRLDALAGQAAQGHTVRLRCKNAEDEVLYVEMVKDPAVGRALTHGFNIDYRTPSGRHRTFVGYGYVLCNKEFNDKPKCDPITAHQR